MKARRSRAARRLLTGAGTYVDDVHLPGLLHAAFVRSAEPHATLRAVDGSAATAVPGVAYSYALAAQDCTPVYSSLATSGEVWWEGL